MTTTFIEQSVRPGQHISFKCIATGSPPPQVNVSISAVVSIDTNIASIVSLQFSWLLDSQPIIEVSSLHRYAIGQYVDSAGDVISHLNITHVRTDDGGLYRCIASNSMGSIEHAARLNVYGKSINFG